MTLGILIALGVVVAGVVLLRSRRQRAHTVAELTQVDPFPATPGGAILRSYLAAICAPGVDEARRAALDREFAEAAAEVVPALVQTWRATPEEATGLRWALAYAAPGAGRSAVSFLREVIVSPVAPERSPDPHGYSTKAWDSIIRSRAVGGLESLAVAGDAGARAALFDCLSHELFSVRALAAVALLHLPDGRQLRDQVQRALPEEEASVLDIERVRVGVVHQVRDPRRHLASTLRREIPLPPSPDDREPTQRAKPRRGSPPPTIRGGHNG